MSTDACEDVGSVSFCNCVLSLQPETVSLKFIRMHLENLLVEFEGILFRHHFCYACTSASRIVLVRVFQRFAVRSKLHALHVLK